MANSTTSLNCLGILPGYVPLNDYLIVFTSGANAGQARQVDSCTNSILYWIDPLPSAPSAGDTFDFQIRIPTASDCQLQGKYTWEVNISYTPGMRAIGSDSLTYIAVNPSLSIDPVTDVGSLYWKREVGYTSPMTAMFTYDWSRLSGLSAFISGGVYEIGGRVVSVSDSVVDLLPNKVNHIELDVMAGAISLNNTGAFSPCNRAIVALTTNASSVTSVSLLCSKYSAKPKLAASFAVTRQVDAGFYATPRGSGSLLEFKGVVYHFGGLLSTLVATAEIWAYDEAMHSWSLVTGTSGTAPSGRYKTADVQYQGKLVYVGGVTGDTPYTGATCVNTVYLYDPVANSWSSPATTGSPPARAWAAHWQVGNLLYLYGGTDGSLPYYDLWTMNLDTYAFTHITAILGTPPALLYATAHVYNNVAYIYGGYTTVAGTGASSNLVALDLNTMTFSTPTLSGVSLAAVGEATSWMWGSNFYIYGGRNGGSVVNNANVIHLNTMKVDVCYPGTSGLTAFYGAPVEKLSGKVILVANCAGNASTVVTIA